MIVRFTLYQLSLRESRKSNHRGSRQGKRGIQGRETGPNDFSDLLQFKMAVKTRQLGEQRHSRTQRKRKARLGKFPYGER